MAQSCLQWAIQALLFYFPKVLMWEEVYGTMSQPSNQHRLHFSVGLIPSEPALPL